MEIREGFGRILIGGSWPRDAGGRVTRNRASRDRLGEDIWLCLIGPTLEMGWQRGPKIGEADSY